VRTVKLRHLECGNKKTKSLGAFPPSAKKVKVKSSHGEVQQGETGGEKWKGTKKELDLFYYNRRKEVLVSEQR